jgi:Domain of unknown function (DUF1929)
VPFYSFDGNSTESTTQKYEYYCLQIHMSDVRTELMKHRQRPLFADLPRGRPLARVALVAVIALCVFGFPSARGAAQGNAKAGTNTGANTGPSADVHEMSMDMAHGIRESLGTRAEFDLAVRQLNAVSVRGGVAVTRASSLRNDQLPEVSKPPEISSPLSPSPASPVAPANASQAAAAVQINVTADGWGAPLLLRSSNGQYPAPVHAALMGDGSVMFVGVSRDVDPPQPTTPLERAAWTYTPAALGTPEGPFVVTDDLAPPYEYDGAVAGDLYIRDDFICMGATHTADGRLLTSGGTRFVKVLSTQEQLYFGLSTQSVYASSGIAKSWSRLPGTMVGAGGLGSSARWYPTTTRLPDGRIVTMGGMEFLSPKGFFPNRSIETVNVPVNSMPTDISSVSRSLFSPPENTSFLLVAQDYAHAFVLPTDVNGADLVMLGEFGFPVLANSRVSNGWVGGREPRPGASDNGINNGVSTAMLPIRVTNGEWGYSNGSLILAGGKMGTPSQRSIDIFDPAAPGGGAGSSGWRPSIDMLVRRHHPSTVLLPDGRTLIINGHDMAGDVNVMRAQYLDPRNGFSLTTGLATSGVVRGYHSIALLLPDGRVLVGGGRDQVTASSEEKPTLQYYFPDYMSKPRPNIVNAPSAVGYGTSFQVTASGPRPDEVVLVALGSMTHSVDMDQRSVQLAATVGVADSNGFTTVSVTGPPNAQIAPPGDYMMFVLDNNHIPSVAKIVRLG